MTGTLGDALALATIAHAGQPYGDQPYIVHPVAVAHLILRTYGSTYDRLLIPALLHDVVEDTAVTITEIRHRFGDGTARIVDGVTRRPGEEYAAFVVRAAQDPDSLLVKLADNTHNLSTLPPGDGRQRRYRRARKVLVEANGGVDPWAALIPDPV